MAPQFIRRMQERREPAMAIHDPEPAMPPPSGDAENPFTRAHMDLAARWDEMASELAHFKATAEAEHAENVYLKEKCASLEKELSHRVSFFELEIERLQQRADLHADENSSRRAKLEIISQALRMVLDETLKPTQAREVAHPPLAEPPLPKPPTHRVAGPRQPRERPEARLADKYIPRSRDEPPEEPDDFVDEADGVNVRSLIDRIAGQPSIQRT